MFPGFGIGSGAIFILTIVVSLAGLKSPSLVNKLMFRPYWLTRGNEWHRLITSGFVHADGNHLLFNMLSFYFFAFSLERAIGPVMFVVLYFVGLVLSDVGTWVKHRNDPNYASLGASGAILAVLFAFIVYFPLARIWFIPAPLFAVLYLIYSWWQARQNRGRVNHDAHLGGAVVGLLFVAVVDPSAYQRFFGVVSYLMNGGG